MTTKIHPSLSREQWLQLRTKYVNSTEISALYRMNPYMTELELYYNKKTGELGEFEENERMLAGRMLEAGIAKIVELKLKCNAIPFKSYLCDDEDLIGSSFDYLISGGEYHDWILEIKNVDYIQYKQKWENDEAPDHIEVQVQHQMELADKEGCVIAALVGGNDLKLIFRERNRDVGQQLRNKASQFWYNVDQNIPPTPDYSHDAEFVIAMHQSSSEEIYCCDENDRTVSLLRKYKQLQDVKTATEKEMEAIKAEVFDTIGDNCRVDSPGVKLTCSMTKENPGTIITQDMVGQRTGGRKSYRNFRVSIK